MNKPILPQTEIKQRELFQQHNHKKTEAETNTNHTNNRTPKLTNPLGLDGFPFTKPRYTWTDAPSWWNPLGEEISEDLGDSVRLAYYGRIIPKSELIEIVPLEVKGDYSTVLNGQIFKVKTLLNE